MVWDKRRVAFLGLLCGRGGPGNGGSFAGRAGGGIKGKPKRGSLTTKRLRVREGGKEKHINGKTGKDSDPIVPRSIQFRSVRMKLSGKERDYGLGKKRRVGAYSGLKGHRPNVTVIPAKKKSGGINSIGTLALSRQKLHKKSPK